MFWIIGCAGLLIFRGRDPDATADEGLIPSATLIAIAIYTALVVFIALLPRRS